MSGKPTPLSGFPELLPAETVVEQQVIDDLRRVFELHGFAGIETRVVEPMDRLAKGGEVDKEIYVLRRALSDEGGSDSGLGLHFDLTVPFARYVLENSGKLEFPFRRYQIQPAWRGERPQIGRYRQFTQADVDIVGRRRARVPPRRRGDAGDGRRARRAAAAAGVVPVQQPQADPGLLPRPRHRRRHRGDPRHRQARQAAGREGRRAARRDRRRDARAGRSGASPSPRSGSRDTRFVEQVRALGVEDDLLETGLAELAAVVEGCAAVAPPTRSPSRPTCASRAASTTTPAPSSRSS